MTNKEWILDKFPAINSYDAVWASEQIEKGMAALFFNEELEAIRLRVAEQLKTHKNIQ